MAKIPEWAIGRGRHNEIEPGVIVRHNPDGTIDEICFEAAGANFHLEQMDAGIYWVGVSWKDADGCQRMQHITLATPRNTPIYPTVYR
jgi:hypothetical protein